MGRERERQKEMWGKTLLENSPSMNITGLPVIGCSLFSWSLRLHPSGTFSGSLTEDGTPASKDENLDFTWSLSCPIYLASSAVMGSINRKVSFNRKVPLFKRDSFPLEFWKHDFLPSVLELTVTYWLLSVIIVFMGRLKLWGKKKVELNWWQFWVPKWSFAGLV